jgi:folate-binding protein YgfZ
MPETSAAQNRTGLLSDIHRRAGATFGVIHGWEMPANFGDWRSEYEAVRTAAGLIDLTHHGAVGVGGGEGAQFLNGLVTNDVKALSAGQGMRAAFLTGHGKVRALCRILSRGSEYVILNDPQTHQKIYDYVFPFSYAGDFKVEDVSASYRMLSVQGPKSLSVMKEVCFEPLPNLPEHSWITTKIAGHDVVACKSSRTGDAGFDVLAREAELADIWDLLLLKGDFHSIKPVGHDALERLRIEAGELVYGLDVDESNMMLETGLTDAVSFTKGCYTGQEAVAMATYRGHVSKRMSGLLIDGETLPMSHDVIMSDEKEIGWITSAVYSVTLNSTIALAYLKYGFFEPGTEVRIETDGKSLKARVVSLPFYHA